MLKRALVLLLLLTTSFLAAAQGIEISGVVVSAENNTPIKDAKIFIRNTSHVSSTDANGSYLLKGIKNGEFELVAFSEGKNTTSKFIKVDGQNLKIDFTLGDLDGELQEVLVVGQQYNGSGLKRLRSVEGTAIYESKKNEVIVLKDVNGNLAGNTARHIFGKVAGLNIWESDGGGIQLGIGSRGLNPSRSTDFNMRQNGYDISADAIGYNESYYTPPAEALERIEVVRGAASLQYGPHFGGMINFVFKKGAANKPIEVETKQTLGSFGFFNSYNAVGGTVGKLNYYAFYQYKRGDGWRENSDFTVHTAYTALNYNLTPKLTIGAQYTYMGYLAHQAGGLTTSEFDRNPRQSKRERNWFKLNWNLVALTADYKINETTKMNVRTFSLFGERVALGMLGNIKNPDLPLDNGAYAYRDLLWDQYSNFGGEARVIKHYDILGRYATFLVGARVYKGLTDRRQGLGSTAKGPDFYYDKDTTLKSDFNFPAVNSSLFLENIFSITPKFTVTPGVRVEYITTRSKGFYYNENKFENTKEQKNKTRSFPLFGIGMSYKTNKGTEFYGNISQNYKAINFNDLRVDNENKQVDPDLRDESGYNVDLGVRGSYGGKLNLDITFFYLYYHDRISSVAVVKDEGDIIRYYTLVTNIGNSVDLGVESLIEADLLGIFRGDTTSTKLFLFSNLTAMDARYISGQYKGRYMEYAPSLIFRSGLTFKKNQFSTTLRYSYTSQHYSDATNAKTLPTEVAGLVPSYFVVDLTAGYTFKYFTLSGGINNLTNNMYFTRRAVSYPGPGIIPSDGRNFFITLGAKF